ncbi:hypothetical protein [Apibacter raozihei]|uniref:hypothetical protein n=1 Tax=Apibacter raozihei TaxID=2500547 RepID=UPI001E5EBE3F|nr:hypothetical protein [Apibacter raozihei]
MKFNSGIVKGKVEAGVATVNVGTVSVGTQVLKLWNGMGQCIISLEENCHFLFN